MPSDAPETADPELAAYNEYLAELGRRGPDTDREDA